jgi:hypothetical protein
LQEARYRLGAALDQHAAQAALGEGRQDDRRCDISLRCRQRQNFRPGQSAIDTLGGYNNAAVIAAEQARMGRQPAARVKDNSDWIGALDVTNGQLRVIGARGFDTDENGVDQCPQAVEMHNARRPVDVMRPASRRCHTTVERLPDLTDNNEVINFSGAERAEYVLPRRG